MLHLTHERPDDVDTSIKTTHRPETRAQPPEGVRQIVECSGDELHTCHLSHVDLCQLVPHVRSRVSHPTRRRRLRHGSGSV